MGKLRGLVETVLKETSYKNSELILKIDEGIYDIFCGKGLEVSKEPVNDGVHHKELPTGFRPSDGTSIDITENIYSTNIANLQVKESVVKESEEHSGYGSESEKFERYFLIEAADEEEGKQALRDLIFERFSSGEEVKISLHEKKADGYGDIIWSAVIKKDMLKKYFNDKWEEECYNQLEGKARIEKVSLGGLPNETYSVVFNVPCSENDIEEVNLYWIDDIDQWIGVRVRRSMEHDHTNPWSEFHDGPFKVENLLMKKLLEAYNVNPDKVKDRYVSSLSPDELMGLAEKVVAINPKRKYRLMEDYNTTGFVDEIVTLHTIIDFIQENEEDINEEESIESLKTICNKIEKRFSGLKLKDIADEIKNDEDFSVFFKTAESIRALENLVEQYTKVWHDVHELPKKILEQLIILKEYYDSNYKKKEELEKKLIKEFLESCS